MRATDPVVVFLVVIVIGIVAGLLYDRFLGPGWLARQFAGTRGSVTSALVGIAGAFIGFHLFALAAAGALAFLGAAIGALVVLWAWRMV
ncbi:MAG: transglycosylase [Pseudorhodoplanes sp.]|nr:transglycosylase [Pseudorhodoplanes sp.]